jgi:RNA polymerase sigma factor (sigma-70 family)
VKLRQLLIQDYGKLRDRLMRRFGSADFATEILHDTYLRLDAAEMAGTVLNPGAYLYRVALNVAADSKRADRRWVDKATIEALRRRDDHELDPEQISQAREEWRMLALALDELPPRRRAIFVAARLDERPHREIAQRFGVSVDTVDRELKLALDVFADRLGKKWQPKRGPKPLKTSKK